MAIALRIAARKAAGRLTIWSAGRKTRTGSPSHPALAAATPSATAAPVSRRIGSPMMFARGTSGSSFRVTATNEREVTTKQSSGANTPESLDTVCRKRLSPPKTSRNCFGRFAVESGQNRSPPPPARITAFAAAIVFPIFATPLEACLQKEQGRALSQTPRRPSLPSPPA